LDIGRLAPAPETLGKDSRGVNASRDAEKPPQRTPAALPERTAGLLRAGFARLPGLVRGRRLELVTGVTVVGGSLLVLAEFLDLYQVQRGVIRIAEQTAGEHHSYALLVAGLAVIAAALAARSTGAWPPAGAAGVIGLAALAVVLFGDLPDATSEGLTADRRIGNAEPAAGFWVELAGALLALGGGGTLALLLRR
jgi:hypothetical protein